MKLLQLIGQFLFNIGVSVDQLGNTLAGGNPDNTISARIGHMTSHKSPRTYLWPYWYFLKWVVDITFYPIDYKWHCHIAYHRNASHEYPTKWGMLGLFLAGIIVFISCIFFFFVFWIFVAPFRLIPRFKFKDKRLRYMKEGTDVVIRKLAGIKQELIESKLSDTELKSKGDIIVNMAEEVRSLMYEDTHTSERISTSID